MFDSSNNPRGAPLVGQVNTGLNNEVLSALKGLHEEWSGVELVPSIAYGLRVYQNGSSLTMHTDRIETHVVSAPNVPAALPETLDALFRNHLRRFSFLRLLLRKNGRGGGGG